MRSRKALIAAFLDANVYKVQTLSGADQDQGHSAFDAVNERYGLRGKRRARTIRAAAVACCIRDGASWIIDLDTLNETTPAREVGGFYSLDVGYEEVPAWVTDDQPIDWSDDFGATQVYPADELAAARAEIAQIKSDRDWADLFYALNRTAHRMQEVA